MSPTVACSPPATRSPALPIGSSRSSLRVARVSGDGSAAASLAERTERRPSEDGTSPFTGRAPRFSFSGSCAAASRSLSVASTGASAGRPPAGPSAVKAQHVLFGFDAPLDNRGGPMGPLLPGRLETKPSLLSMALSDMPLSTSLSFTAPLDLFGSASPSIGFLRQQVRCKRAACSSGWPGSCACSGLPTVLKTPQHCYRTQSANSKVAGCCSLLRLSNSQPS